MANLPDRMPVTIAKRPRNKAGYPVPWFVAKINGDWDFRVVRPGGIETAIRQMRCWICGTQMSLAELQAFVIGPMCAINHVSAEPPSHLACARWAAIACPFLANPQMVRREHNLPMHEAPAGVMIARNPGVTLVWAVRYGEWSTFQVDQPGAGRGILIDIGDAPRKVEWYAKGRAATRDEVLASIDRGLPTLTEAYKQDGGDALEQLAVQTERALSLVPA